MWINIGKIYKHFINNFVLKDRKMILDIKLRNEINMDIVFGKNLLGLIWFYFRIYLLN